MNSFVIYYKGKIGILYKGNLSSSIEFKDGLYLVREIAPLSEIEASIIGEF